MLVSNLIKNIEVGFNKLTTPANNTLPNTNNVANVFKADAITLSANTATPPEKPVYDPNAQPPADYKQSFFDKPAVRIGGMMIGGAAVLGTVGYLAGTAMGSAAVGMSIGMGLGALAPIALVAYGLYSWGKK